MAESIRLVTEHKLLTTAFKWSEDAPRWFREHEDPETLESFLDSADDRLFYGIFAPDLTALIRLTPFAGGVFAIDLFANRGSSRQLITEGGRSIQSFLYDNNVAQGFFGWIAEVNRPVRAIYDDLGFHDTGVRCYRGKTHNRPVKWSLRAHSKNYG